MVWFVIRSCRSSIAAMDTAPRVFLVGRAVHPASRRWKALGSSCSARSRIFSPGTTACRIFVAPTRFAAGIPLKVCEASAAGIPVVATDLVFEQLSWKGNVRSDREARPSTSPKRASRSTPTKSLWNSIRKIELKLVEKAFSRPVFNRQLGAIFARRQETTPSSTILLSRATTWIKRAPCLRCPGSLRSYTATSERRMAGTRNFQHHRVWPVMAKDGHQSRQHGMLALATAVRLSLRSRLKKGALLARWLVLKLSHTPRRRAERLQLFDPDWYLSNYPEVATAGHDPFSHYLAVGAAEGRDPGPNFSTLGYLQRYPDLAKAGVNPLLHYLEFGLREDRDIFPADKAANDYQKWIEQHEQVTAKSRAALRRRLSALSRRPLISILMPTYNTKIELLRAAIESVLGQAYQEWQLCIADDASTDPEVRKTLDRYAEADDRIKVVYRDEQGGISKASNSALEIASGKWVAMLDHDDLLAPQALLSVAETIKAKPDAQLIYSDEDKITETGRRFRPYFKPDFSLELFRSQNYLNHLTVHRTANIRGRRRVARRLRRKSGLRSKPQNY